jgi:hypothetical protein
MASSQAFRHNDSLRKRKLAGMPSKKSDDSSQLSTELQTIDQFIKISKDAAKLPSLVMADSKGCASDFVEFAKNFYRGTKTLSDGSTSFSILISPHRMP